MQALKDGSIKKIESEVSVLKAGETKAKDELKLLKAGEKKLEEVDGQL